MKLKRFSHVGKKKGLFFLQNTFFWNLNFKEDGTSPLTNWEFVQIIGKLT